MEPDEENSRAPAEVLEAAVDRLLVQVPDTADTGQLRVAVDDLESNDHHFRMRFRPRADIFLSQLLPLPEEEPASSVGILGADGELSPTLIIGQDSDDVEFEKVSAVLSEGRVNVEGLVMDQVYGTGTLVDESNGNPTNYQVIFRDSNPGLDGVTIEHRFDLNQVPDDFSAATIFVTDIKGADKGVEIEMDRGGVIILGRTLTIHFDPSIYTPPAAGTSIKSSVLVESERWCFFDDSRLVVIVEGDTE